MMRQIRSRAMSRHPLEFGLVAALCAVAIFELTRPPDPMIVAEIPYPIYRVDNWLLIVSTVLIFLGAFLHQRTPPFSLHIELAGLCGFTCVMASYVVLLHDAAPTFWGTWMQSVILSVAFLWRAAQLLGMLHAMVRVTKHLDQVEAAIERTRQRRRRGYRA